MLFRLARRTRAKALIVQKSRSYRKFGIVISPEWYAKLNIDVGASNMDPIVHFVEHGSKESRALPVAFESYWLPEFNNAVKTYRIVDQESKNAIVSIFIDCRDTANHSNLSGLLKVPGIAMHLIGDARQILNFTRKHNFDVEQIETQNFFDYCNDYFLFVRIGDDFTAAAKGLLSGGEPLLGSTPIQFPLTGQHSNRSIIGHSFINSITHCALVTIETDRIGHNLPRKIFGTTLRGTLIPRSYGINKLGPSLQLNELVQSWNKHCWTMKLEGKSHVSVGSESIVSSLGLPIDDLKPNFLVELPDEISSLFPRMFLSCNISTTKSTDALNILIAPQDRFSELPWDSLVDRVVADLGDLGIQVVPTDGTVSGDIENAQVYFYSEFDFSRRLLPLGPDTRNLFVVKQGVCKCSGPNCEKVRYKKSQKSVSQKWRDTSPSNQVIFVSCDADSQNNHDLIACLTTLKVFPIIADR
jgi:hypothetical protein